jgi:uncharacterized protein (TIGR02284 family)
MVRGPTQVPTLVNDYFREGVGIALPHPLTKGTNMSTDRSVTKDLMEILSDGKDGFAHAAKELTDSDRPELAPKFTGYAAQRAGFYSELERLAAGYGDEVEDSGSVAGTMHRAWMSVKDVLTSSDPKRILAAAETGEDHAVKAYTDALGQDISAGLRTTLQAQFTQVKAAHDEVKSLRNSMN